MTEELYKWEASVRDYELDGQNIVNHATYVNYFEQARNDYVRTLGIDFVEYHNAGFNFVVTAIQVEYRYPLFAQDKFYVTAKITGFDARRFYFEQKIKRNSDNRLIAKANVHAACIDHRTGRVHMPEMLITLLENLTTA